MIKLYPIGNLSFALWNCFHEGLYVNFSGISVNYFLVKSS